MKENTLILTITGSDSTSGSGVQADIKTISSLGGFAASAITSITLQNTLGIQEFYDVPADVIVGQIEAIINDIQPSVVKIGMIRSLDALNAITEVLRKYNFSNIIYDPIIYSSCGDKLMDEAMVSRVKKVLLPICSIVITRKRDAEYILNTKVCIKDECQDAIQKFKALGCGEVILLDEAIDTQNNHGDSNSFSSALAVYLTKGFAFDDAVKQAKTYVNHQISRSSNLIGRAGELYNDFLDKVEQYYNVNSDVHFYADSLNVSSRYLAQVCKRIANNSPKAIIDGYIIQEIQRQLITTEKTVQEIAYDFGFSSQAHLTKFFRKMTNDTPTNYRKPHKKDIAKK